MLLDRITVRLRARESWEAIDLGAVMMRAWWRPVYGAWLAVVVPLAILLQVLLQAHPLLVPVILWWLKPLYDRLVLHVLSQAVFGTIPGVRDTLAALPTLLRASGLVGALSWRRFDPARSFNLAVRQLERQQGKPARERERLLGRRAAGQATGLLYACMAFEFTVIMSLSLGVDLVTPAGTPSTLTADSFLRGLFGIDDEAGPGLMQNVFYLAAITLVEPLFVASGFSLYLNRRTALEAWDLELAFRRMDHAAESTPIRTLAGLIACCLIPMLVALPPKPTWAASPAPDSSTLIKEVLASPELQEYKDELVWRPRGATNKDKPDSSGTGWMEMLSRIAGGIAEVMRILAYVALAVVVILLVRYLLSSAHLWRGEKAAPAEAEPPPETLFGLDVRPESLPPNLAQLAAQAAERDPRLALSLLYRGALATLIHRDRMPIDSGDTEGDCLRRVRTVQAADLADYFTRLVAAWSQSAYAGRPPDASIVRSLCIDWGHHFAPSAGASA